MKKFLTLVLPAIFAVALIGCKEPEPEAEVASASADSVTVSETLKADESYVEPTEDNADTIIENLIKDLSKDENAEKMLESAVQKIYENIKIVGLEENAARSITVDLTSLSQFIDDLRSMKEPGEISFNLSVPAGSVIDESGLKVDVESLNADGKFKIDMSEASLSGSASVEGSANAKASASVDFEKFDPELSKDSIIKAMYCNAVLSANCNITINTSLDGQDISGGASANSSYGASMVFADNGVAGILVANSNMSLNVDDSVLKSMMSNSNDEDSTDYLKVIENAISGEVTLSLYDLDCNEIKTKTISAKDLLNEFASGFVVD